MMKAHCYEAAGDAADVLTLVEMEIPEPGAGEVRVKMAFSGVNPHDTKKRMTGSDLKRFPRIIPNCDGSGVIDQVGEGVSPDRVGKRIWIFGTQVRQAFGTGAEYCIVPDALAVDLPETMSLEEGAATGIPAVTAYRAIFDDGDVAGKTIYVTGATGRVGSYALQFAKQAGATVIAATGSNERADALKKLGADFVINYNDDDRAGQVKSMTEGKGVSRIVECSFGGNIDFNEKILAKHGTIAAFGFDDLNTSHSMPHIPLMVKNAVLRYIAIFTMSQGDTNEILGKVNDLLSTGTIHHNIAHIFPFERMVEAHRAVEEKCFSGSVLVEVKPY